MEIVCLIYIFLPGIVGRLASFCPRFILDHNALNIVVYEMRHWSKDSSEPISHLYLSLYCFIQSLDNWVICLTCIA